MIETERVKEMKGWKKALILGMAVIFTVGVTSLDPTKRNTLSSPLKEVVLPGGFIFEEGQDMMKMMAENPVPETFRASLDQFSYNTTVKIFETSQENTNYSPLSLYYALTMAASGAEGETLEELLTLLGAKDKTSLLEGAGNLYRRLYLDNEIGQLKIANSLWMNKDVVWKKSFVEKAANHLYATSYLMDFEDENTEVAMEEWIKSQTKGTLAPVIDLNPEAILSMLSTVYFYDEWIDAFQEVDTKEDVFDLQDGRSVKTDFMNRQYASHGFTQGDGFIRSSLQLKNSSSMVFILPDKGTSPRDLLATSDAMKRVFNEGQEGYGEVIWQIPKFSFGSKIDVKETLQRLGIQSAFEESANFQGITDQMAYINSIHQETHMGIDEKGVEASAFTQIDYAGAAQPLDKAEMILNRPFIYGIKTSEGALLFVGICENPLAK